MKLVYLKPGKEKAIANKHPWIFSGAVGRIDDSVEPGDAVLIKDASGKDLAIGHWCSNDGLVCRIFSFGKEPIDGLFASRLDRARKLRTSLNLPAKNTNGYRLIHGEGDGLSGLVVDIFSDTASIQLSNPGFKPYISKLCDFLDAKNIFFADSNGESSWIKGKSEKCPFLENGLKFLANPKDGQKTGHFLDQRDNRLLVKNHSQDRSVLDAFCHSGGFSTYALAGGAKHVESVDISETAIEQCLEHVAINNLGQNHKAIVADCFSYLRTIPKDKFDLIVLDPPAFAKSAASVNRAARGYKDINLLAMKNISSGGLIFTYSCSQHIDADLFKKIIFAAAKDSGREVKILGELFQGADHPVSVYCPQSSYLKGLMLYVE